MKKLLLPVAALFVMTATTSCFKTYNCKCTTVSNGQTSTTSESVTSGALFGGKKTAENSCKANESSSSYSVTTCQLD